MHNQTLNPLWPLSFAGDWLGCCCFSRVLGPNLGAAAVARGSAAIKGCHSGEVLRKIRGGKVFIEADAKGIRGLGAACMRGDLRVVWKVADGSVFVVRRPGEASVKVQMACALSGAYQVAPTLLISGHGPAIKYLPVARARRTIWVSARCYEEERPFWNFMQNMLAAMRGAKLKLMCGGADADMVILMRKHARRQGLFIVVAQPTELHLPAHVGTTDPHPFASSELSPHPHPHLFVRPAAPPPLS